MIFIFIGQFWWKL